MEPAARDADFRVAAVPMPLEWLDGRVLADFAETCPRDERGNALAAPRHVLVDSRRTLVASSEPGHVIAAIGCEECSYHTPRRHLGLPRRSAEDIKKVYGLVGERFGAEYL